MPVGLAEPPEVGTEEATEDEDTAAEPNYAFAKGYGRFGIGYTRLATALGNFEQGNWGCPQRILPPWISLHSEDGHTTNMAHISIPKNDGISSVHGSLGTPTLDFNSRTKQALRDHMGYSQEAPDPSNKARRTVLPPGSGSSSSAAWSSWHSRPPPSPSPYGWSYGWWQ